MWYSRPWPRPEVGLAADVARYGAGVVCPGEAVQLADALDKLCRNPAQRERMGQAGVQTVREHFSWTAIAGQTVQLYHELTEKSIRNRKTSTC